ncbi:EF-hand domain pair [Phytophthora cactorum]|nr:EF-hand domain pair [Phytophthora cactorum]
MKECADLKLDNEPGHSPRTRFKSSTQRLKDDDVGHVGDLIYSEPRRRLAVATSSESSATTLHLDERYFFDGTHSDFAQQFYRRYLAGDKVAAIADTSSLDEAVDYVSEFGLEFANLPAMLQQAVVWDMGYVAAADLGYIKVYTKCGMRMSELQLTRSAYRSAGCTEQRCSSPNGELFYQSMFCSGYQMGNVSLCAATNGITPVHGAMWADGGTDDVVPVSEMQRHEWNDAGVAYTILAIHLSGDPNSYGKCVMPSMIVPCVVYDASTADKKDWCSPEHGEIVQQWLELEKTGGVLVAESSGWQKAALPVTITSVVLLLLILIAAFIFWRKIRDKQHQIEDYYEQKRAILGGRGSDAFSMMDDIDFILEAPGRSFIEKGCQQTWVAWGHTPAKSKRPDVGEYNEDLDATLRGSFEDVNDVDSLYLQEGSHHTYFNSSKATTTGLTTLHPLMASLEHPNVLGLTGVAWNTLENMLLIMEFMELGDLHDFGVSRTRRGDETMTSGVGTAYWTAPEVLAGHKYSEKADIYSLRVDRRPKWSWVSSSDCWKADQSGDFWKLDKAMASGGYDVDYAALGLTPERFEAFKTVFSSVDKAHTGAISTKTLDALCFQLGETLDQEELAVAAASSQTRKQASSTSPPSYRVDQ